MKVSGNFTWYENLWYYGRTGDSEVHPDVGQGQIASEEQSEVSQVERNFRM